MTPAGVRQGGGVPRRDAMQDRRIATGQQRAGVRALLFDRIVRRERDGDTDGGSGGLAPAHDVYDENALRASIAEQLYWLLNTRVPIDFHALDARTRAGIRSTIDYGLPDLTAYPVGDDHARVRLHDHLAQTIALYEPRLLHPQVVLAPGDGRNATLVAEISGAMRIGLIEVPIAFRFPIDAEKGAGHGG